jgi:hypothetical protein
VLNTHTGWQCSGSVSFWTSGSVIICTDPEPDLNKKLKKNLISIVSLLFNNLLSLKLHVYVPTVCSKHIISRKNFRFGILKATEEKSRIRMAPLIRIRRFRTKT